ncbi:hypothetical protein OQA88_5484 [Cercophora sp. LCS_1]
MPEQPQFFRNLTLDREVSVRSLYLLLKEHFPNSTAVRQDVYNFPYRLRRETMGGLYCYSDLSPGYRPRLSDDMAFLSRQLHDHRSCVNFFNMLLVLGVVITLWKTTVVIFATILDTEEEEDYDFVMDALAIYVQEGFESEELLLRENTPGVFITDGESAIIRAIDKYFPNSERQRYV